MKILLISHPALSAELGAAQVALSLAEALRARGHDARAWSPEPLPAGTRWWNIWRHQRSLIERFAAAEGPFDVIDVPAISASRALAQCGRISVRSVQPELRYLWHGIGTDLRQRPSPRAVAHAAAGVPVAGAILRGWQRAATILCLGSEELAWMRHRFPFWSAKLKLYFNAVPPLESAALARVRRERPPESGERRERWRFLWIGRWSPHKGIRRLLRFLRARIEQAPADRFTLAGCGPLAARDIPAEWLRSGAVSLIPSFARAELPALLAAHQVGLFTSDVEGWGLNLNEMLESGMIVFATAAGAVSDLRPYFPASLRAFPPPGEIAPGPLEALDANGYFAAFTWPAIARSYELQVLAGAR